MILQPIPPTLAPFLQEYDLARLSPEKDAHTLIERTLQYGNRAELRWLFQTYPHSQIRGWVEHFGQEKLPEPHRTFWRLMLEIKK
jgi:hypothetical protein